ncbi:adenylate/guanylate cyclase domain-containing protein [Agrococcus jejuensis]|uniref:adenylate/guanylate cyclase domain-containing protein n=1 Tax=Agrococcus jejuensis TaxID=399736 RepID=UPI00164275C2|nr:adenylate/guanylate cyclase domain-containing protein [Agrococcus jejuensis]
MSDALSTTSEPVAQRRRRGLALGTQAKLLVMLLVVSLVSSIAIGVIGVVNGRGSLQDAAYDQLTAIRELRADAIESEFSRLQTGVQLDSRNASAVEGARAFIDGFEQLESAPIDPALEQRLQGFYDDEYIPALEARTGEQYESESFVPATNAGRYLQANYTSSRGLDDFDAALEAHDAGDGSAWSAANAQYGPYFTGLVDALDYEDVLLLNLDAEVVFSAYQSVDLGLSMRRTVFEGSALTRAFDEVLQSGSLDAVVTTDFERYLPSLGVPTAWVLSPIGDESELIGVLAVQVPITQINAVMTGDRQWAEQGLGQTGEVYLAGSDGLMRSESRLLVEDPDAYADAVIANGTSVATAERVVEVAGTVLLQPVDDEGVQDALRGESGVAETADYRSGSSLVAYAPLDIEGLDWVIVARIDADEAFAPVSDFTRTVVLSILGLLLLVSIVSLLLAQVFTRPIGKLVGAVRQVAGGDYTVQVPVRSRDEFGDLGTAFNEMATSLRLKQDLIDQQQDENVRLMRTLMPDSVAERLKGGDEAIAERHENVSVVFAELVGWEDHARGLALEEEVAQLNFLTRGFDEAARKAGVEQVRTLRGGYLASVGLEVPRVDNARRAVDFGIEMRAVVERFNAQHGTKVALRAGVDTGTVTSGLVARTNLAYDLWGDAVSLAYKVRTVTGEPGVYVSDAVHDRLRDTVEFTNVGTVDVAGTAKSVWRVG